MWRLFRHTKGAFWIAYFWLCAPKFCDDAATNLPAIRLEVQRCTIMMQLQVPARCTQQCALCKGNCSSKSESTRFGTHAVLTSHNAALESIIRYGMAARSGSPTVPAESRLTNTTKVSDGHKRTKELPRAVYERTPLSDRHAEFWPTPHEQHFLNLSCCLQAGQSEATDAGRSRFWFSFLHILQQKQPFFRK